MSAVSGEVVRDGTVEAPMGQSPAAPARDFLVSEYSSAFGSMNRQAQRIDGPQGAAYDRAIQVVPAKEADASKIAEISRDLQVMLHILTKRSVGYEIAYGNYNRLFADLGQIFVADDRVTKAMYIEGFGALFFMEVNFPVRPSPASEKQDTKGAEDAIDQTWKQAERELFSPESYDGGHLAPTIAFDAEKVESLKTELITKLKYASNIRSRGPDDRVVVTVYGGSPNIPGAIAYQPSALTIRAKKSDIDAFGRGELGVAQFREKVEVLTYTPFGRATLTQKQPTGQPPKVAERIDENAGPADRTKPVEPAGTVTGTETVPYKR